MLFCVITKERLLVKVGCPLWDGGRATRVGWENEGDFAGEDVLSRRQDKLKVAILAPAAGTLN